MEHIATALTDAISGAFGDKAVALIPGIISLFPILEMRGGLIAARILDIPYIQALITCIIGNIIPIPFILLFIRKIFSFLKRFKHLGKLVTKLEEKAMSKKHKVERNLFIGLILFVGIPLPGTGAWTGALLASLLYMDIKKASLAILIGLALCAVIMSIITYLIPYIIASV